MSWIDDSKDRVNKDMTDKIEKANHVYQSFSPIIMKLLAELGDNLFSKEGIFGKKRYYTVEPYVNNDKGIYGWSFKTNEGKVKHPLTVNVYVDELKDDMERFKFQNLLNKSFLRAYSNYDFICAKQKNSLYGEVIITEEELLVFLKDVVAAYTKQHFGERIVL